MIEQVVVIVGATLLVMISPGPDMVIVLRNTLVGGREAGIRTSAGVLAGNSVHIFYCVVGIGWVISQSIVAFSILKYAAAAYLVYLGIMTFRSGSASPDTPGTGEAGKGRGWFLQGFINNILNPKGTLFYLGIFTIVITPETSVGATLVLVLCMLLVSASFWLVFVLTLDRPVARTLLAGGHRVVKRVFGVLLVALGLRVAAMER